MLMEHSYAHEWGRWWLGDISVCLRVSAPLCSVCRYDTAGSVPNPGQTWEAWVAGGRQARGA